MRHTLLLSALSLACGLAGPQAATAQPAGGAEKAALEYLARQVPLWKSDNGCYSCHNNGDGARVLYTAQRLGRMPPQSALRDTTGWLTRPHDWDENRGAPEFSDKKLARIQFAAALETVVEAGLAPRETLVEAARSLLPHQEADGSWQVDTGGLAGSPITYGAALATYTARRVLSSAADPSFDDAIERAGRWFERTPPRNVLDASATALALSDSPLDGGGAGRRRAESVALIAEAQNSDGGWGPYRNSPSEPFDTALALLALDSLPQPEDERIRRGREFLIKTQLTAGGWPETTRPSGSQSYAQHISTTAWATLALLETNSE